MRALEKWERRIRPDELTGQAGLYGLQVSTFVGPRAPATEFSVQLRTSVNRASSPEAQQALRRWVQEFQDLCEYYRWLETIAGALLPAGLSPKYKTAGIPPEAAAPSVDVTVLLRVPPGSPTSASFETGSISPNLAV